VSSAVLSPTLQVPVIVLMKAVKSKAGDPMGFVAFQVSPDTLSSLVGGIRIGSTGYGRIVDKKGLMIATPDKASVMKLDVTKTILEEMKRLGDAAAEVKLRIAAMAAEGSGIGSSSQAVADLAGSARDTIDRMDKAIGRFKV
jgi:hypothetical protein